MSNREENKPDKALYWRTQVAGPRQMIHKANHLSYDLSVFWFVFFYLWVTKKAEKCKNAGHRNGEEVEDQSGSVFGL